jgi:hypothetical protein
MLYLFALVPEPGALPAAEEPLSLEGVAGIGAVVGRVDGRAEPSEEAILRHARVVECVAAVNDAVLPVRFGRAFVDRPALRQAIRDRADELGAALERVRGCVELGLRVADETADEPMPTLSGTEFMARRLRRVQAAERLAGELHAPLAELSRASVHRVLSTPRLLLSAAYLVPREGVDAFREAVERLAAAHAALDLVCTGPWPPYSFGDVEDAVA